VKYRSDGLVTAIKQECLKMSFKTMFRIAQHDYCRQTVPNDKCSVILSTRSAGGYSTTRATLRTSFKVKGKVTVTSSHRLYISSLPLHSENKMLYLRHYRRAGHTVSAERGGHTACLPMTEVTEHDVMEYLIHGICNTVR